MVYPFYKRTSNNSINIVLLKYLDVRYFILELYIL